MTGAYPTLKRFARAARRAEERCELCGEAISGAHQHLLEVRAREVRCVCRACSILFHREAASEGRYRLIPDRRLYLEDFRLSDPEWQALRIPVGVAFLFRSTAAGNTVARYPSPMGATEALLPDDVWQDLERANPLLAGMAPDVEALLVNRAGGERQYFLVPIDECYRLVALVRLYWRGLTGGEAVRKEMARFFAGLRGRCTGVPGEARAPAASGTG
jgi:uncharacterized protein DUF5947